ncbi:MAG: SDR family NAD(P)-dependent oxidoreductase [Chloroherpetonaceae bacterium]|nr:SDR family NAD(P)-dependent oxidoreductase [Chloroherpetonaceae bacterium]
MERTALITGGAGFLGQAVVRSFLRLGYRVIITIRKDEQLNVKSIAELKEGHLRLHTVRVDLTNENETQSVVKDLIQKFGKIDTAVFCVGGFQLGTFLESDINAIESMIQLNFFTAYNVARPVFNEMLGAEFGRIVLIGAKPALEPKSGNFAFGYSLSKSLIVKFADLLNAEGESKNVITSVIVPSILDTPVNRESMPDADYSKWVTPEEVAEVIAITVSDKSFALRDPVIKVYGKS